MVPVAAVGTAATLPIDDQARGRRHVAVDRHARRAVHRDGAAVAGGDRVHGDRRRRARRRSAARRSHRIVVSTFSTPPVMITGTYPTVTLRPDSPIAVQFDQADRPGAIAEVPARRAGQDASKRSRFTLTTLDGARRCGRRTRRSSSMPRRARQLLRDRAPRRAWPAGIERPRRAREASTVARGSAGHDARDAQAGFTIASRSSSRGMTCDDMQVDRDAGAVVPGARLPRPSSSRTNRPGTYRSSKIQIEGQPFEDHKPRGERRRLVDAERRRQSVHDRDRRRHQRHLRPAADGPQAADVHDDARALRSVPVGRRRACSCSIRASRSRSGSSSTQAIASLRVQLFQVEPTDYFAFRDFERGKRATPPGKHVYDKQHAVGARHGAIARVDLRPALRRPAAATSSRSRPRRRRAAKLDEGAAPAGRLDPGLALGVTARIDGERVNAWTHDITPSRFLEPIPGVKTSLLVEGRTTRTRGDHRREGHAAFELLPRQKPRKTEGRCRLVRRRRAVARRSRAIDSTFTAIARYEKAMRQQHARWYVTDDRFTYKPGETGLRQRLGAVDARRRQPGPRAAGARAIRSRYTLHDARGNKLASGTAPVTAQGGFDLEVKLPANANLGTAYVHASRRKRQRATAIRSRSRSSARPRSRSTLDDDVTHAARRRSCSARASR